MASKQVFAFLHLALTPACRQYIYFTPRFGSPGFHANQVSFITLRVFCDVTTFVDEESIVPYLNTIKSLCLLLLPTYPTKWGRYNMFSSCCDKDTAFIFITGLPDVNPP
jgi:hypothetical protein